MTAILISASRKPRNPLVPAARMRRAGRHDAAVASARQRGQQSLRRELRELRPPSP